ncbi:MAG: hypothetical protein U0Y68_03660 [Blastocatellia bacterium]
MERVVIITLRIDSDGNRILELNPPVVAVSPVDVEEDKVTVRWILQEVSPFPPVARRFTVTFTEVPTPFNRGGTATAVETYAGYVGDSGSTTDKVLDSAVGKKETDVKFYKYNVAVETTDSSTPLELVSVDPHVGVQRKKITKDTILGY